jgi:hypothetical protein
MEVEEAVFGLGFYQLAFDRRQAMKQIICDCEAQEEGAVYEDQKPEKFIHGTPARFRVSLVLKTRIAEMSSMATRKKAGNPGVWTIFAGSSVRLRPPGRAVTVFKEMRRESGTNGATER